MKVLVFKDIKNKRWTIWDEAKKKHLGYADTLTLKNCSFIVLQDKSEKIKQTKKRFPHAWIVGEMTESNKSLKKEVCYNPFTMNQFKSVKNKRDVLKASFVKLEDNGKVFI